MSNKRMNMNGSNDPSYRYTMPTFNVTNAGNGNGKFTMLNNIEQISKSINHPVPVLCKYIASITGSSYIESRKQFTGSHSSSDLNKLIIQYIKYMVLCPKCGIPETVPKVFGTKKNAGINLSCSACKNESPIITNNKFAEKGSDIIVKYLNAGHIWEISSGSIVNNDCNLQSNNFLEESVEEVNIDDI